MMKNSSRKVEAKALSKKEVIARRILKQKRKG